MLFHFSQCAAAVLLITCACSRSVAPTEKSTEPRTIETESGLRQALRTGLEEEKVVALLGRPQSIEELGEGVYEWNYTGFRFPAEKGMAGTHVVAVSVGMTNRHVAYLGCTYVGPPGGDSSKVLDMPPTLGAPGTSSLRFFILVLPGISGKESLVRRGL